jgi:hypothetical protein
MFFLVSMNKCGKGIEQAVKRMLFIGADFVQSFIHSFYRRVVFPLVANGKQGSDICPAGLNLVVYKSHFFQSPRSYSA